MFLSGMAIIGSVNDYLVRGHQKVISHYRALLRATDLSVSERKRIEARIAQEEDELKALIEGL
jgi:hypothetical protein